MFFNQKKKEKPMQKSKVKSALILIGGYGTRLRPLTFTTSKPLVPFVNKPILFHQIDALFEAGIVNIILATSSKDKNTESNVMEYASKYVGLNIVFSYEDFPLGTAGPIKHAQNHLTFPFFVLNSDITCVLPLEAMIKNHKKVSATILTTTVEHPEKYGVVVTKHKIIEKFVEKPSTFVSNKINAGVYLLEKSVLDLIKHGECSIEKDVFPLLAQKGKLGWFPLDGYWMDIGQPKDFLKGVELFLSRDDLKVEEGSVFYEDINISKNDLNFDLKIKESRNASLKNEKLSQDKCLGEYIELKSWKKQNKIAPATKEMIQVKDSELIVDFYELNINNEISESLFLKKKSENENRSKFKDCDESKQLCEKGKFKLKEIKFIDCKSCNGKFLYMEKETTENNNDCKSLKNNFMYVEKVSGDKCEDCQYFNKRYIQAEQQTDEKCIDLQSPHNDVLRPSEQQTNEMCIDPLSPHNDVLGPSEQQTNEMCIDPLSPHNDVLGPSEQQTNEMCIDLLSPHNDVLGLSEQQTNKRCIDGQSCVNKIQNVDKDKKEEKSTLEVKKSLKAFQLYNFDDEREFFKRWNVFKTKEEKFFETSKIKKDKQKKSANLQPENSKIFISKFEKKFLKSCGSLSTKNSKCTYPIRKNKKKERSRKIFKHLKRLKWGTNKYKIIHENKIKNCDSNIKNNNSKVQKEITLKSIKYDNYIIKCESCANKDQNSQKYYDINEKNIKLKKTVIHHSVSIGSNSEIGPNVVLGKNVIIGDFVKLTNVTVFDGTIIESGSYLKNCLIGWNCRIKKWTNITNETVLGSGVDVDEGIVLNKCVVLPFKRVSGNNSDNVLI